MTGNQCGRSSYTKISRRTSKFQEISRSCRHPVLWIRSWRMLLHMCQTDALGALTRLQHFSMRHDIMTAIFKVWRQIEIRLCQTMHVHLKTNPANIMPKVGSRKSALLRWQHWHQSCMRIILNSSSLRDKLKTHYFNSIFSHIMVVVLFSLPNVRRFWATDRGRHSKSIWWYDICPVSPHTDTLWWASHDKSKSNNKFLLRTSLRHTQ